MKIIKNLKAEELRKSILQLAIQGKLVKQDPNDEPASELVKKIKKEKEESFIFKGDDNCYYEKIDENEPIKLEDLPFKIPENWTWIRLKNIVCIETGKKDANFGSIDGNYNFYTCALEPIKSKSYTYDGEYLILPGNGANIGKSIHFIGKFEAYQRTYLLSKVFSILNFKYLKYVLDIFWESWNKNKMFGSAIPYIKLINLEKFIIPFPPLDEQERIVKKIQSIDLLIQQYNEYETKLTKLESEFEEKLKKSILQYAIQGKLVKQDPNDEPASELIKKIYEEKQKLILEGKIKRDKYESHIYQGTDKNYYEKIDENESVKLEDLPFKIPENWTWIRLKNIFSINAGATFKKEDSFKDHKEGMIRILRGGNILSSKYILKSDDIYIPNKLVSKNILLNIYDLITPVVSSLENIGKIAIIDSNLKDITVGGFVYIFRLYFKNKTISNIVHNFICSPHFQNTLKNITRKSGQAFYNLGKEKLSELYLPIPPLSEQKRIISKINSLFSLL